MNKSPPLPTPMLLAVALVATAVVTTLPSVAAAGRRTTSAMNARGACVRR